MHNAYKRDKIREIKYNKEYDLFQNINWTMSVVGQLFSLEWFPSIEYDSGSVLLCSFSVRDIILITFLWLLLLTKKVVE